jgi:hypothetical protein
MNKTNKSNKLMWIVRNNETGEFLHKDRRYDYTRKLQNALLMPSRRIARNSKDTGESVYKVRLGKSGIQMVGPEWS